MLSWTAQSGLHVSWAESLNLSVLNFKKEITYSVYNTTCLLLMISVSISFTEGSYWVCTSQKLLDHQLYRTLWNTTEARHFSLFTTGLKRSGHHLKELHDLSLLHFMVNSVLLFCCMKIVLKTHFLFIYESSRRNMFILVYKQKIIKSILLLLCRDDLDLGA